MTSCTNVRKCSWSMSRRYVTTTYLFVSMLLNLCYTNRVPERKFTPCGMSTLQHYIPSRLHNPCSTSLCQALGQWRRAKKWVSSKKAGERPHAFFAPVCFLDPFFRLAWSLDQISAGREVPRSYEDDWGRVRHDPWGIPWGKLG